MMQQQQGSNFQVVMKEPPAVLTTKDHLYIKDMLSWNLDAFKKAFHAAQLCSDPDVKAVLNEGVQMHQRHYDSILNHLEKEMNKSQTSQMAIAQQQIQQQKMQQQQQQQQ